MMGDYDFSDTDCDTDCDDGRCTCDEAFPSASIVAGCIVAALLLVFLAVTGAQL